METRRVLIGLQHFVGQAILVSSLLPAAPPVGLVRRPEIAPPSTQGAPVVRHASDVAVKAAFLYNFSTFTEWPTLSRGAPIVACIVGDDRIAAAFAEIAGVHTVADHRLVIERTENVATWRACHLLFIADTQSRRHVDGLAEITRLPVLTVSDTKGFAQAGGIIELFRNGGQLHFRINVDAAARAGVLLSSQLLSLATVVHQTRVPDR